MDIFITGASSGFGAAIARRFARENNRIWITGRRSDRLEALSKELKEKGCREVQTSILDVRDKNSVQQAARALESQWGRLDLLVNNAGLALGFSGIGEGDFQDWDTMIDTNVKGLLYVSRCLIPLMQKQRQGHIINIGSTAGKVAYQNGNVYCATKFAVDALTQSMRIDLLPYGVKVTAINPGMAETEFSLVRFHGDAEKAAGVYEGFAALQAEDIAHIVHYCASLPAHVCINDLTVTCTQQANSIYKMS